MQGQVQNGMNAQTVFRSIDINTGYVPENNRRQGWKGDLQPAKLNVGLRGPTHSESKGESSWASEQGSSLLGAVR